MVRSRAWLRDLKWLLPGIGVKRWVLLIGFGLTTMVIGLVMMIDARLLGRAAQWVASLLRHANEDVRFRLFSLGLAAAVTGLYLAISGLRRLIKTMMDAVLPAGKGELVDILLEHRQLSRGPRVVVIGGGSGLATLLRGLKKHTSNITAIVTVADSGGSSGRLREEMGIPPPGDIRRCLVALADKETLMEELFQFRFTEGKGLAGHAFGNLFIAAMTSLTGDFEKAVKESSKVLAIRGQVLPATLDDVTLSARMADGVVVQGEADITASHGRIRNVFLTPADPEPTAEALEAIRNADMVVLGPGSLYTSVLPNILIPRLAEEIRRSKALRVYVSNVMTQPGETDGYTAADHVRVMVDALGPGVLHYALLSESEIPESLVARYLEQGAFPVKADAQKVTALGVRPVVRSLLSFTDLVRHDPDLLAQALLELLTSKGKAMGSRLLDLYLTEENTKEIKGNRRK